MKATMLPFVHLHVHSAFSFLDGSSSVESLVMRASQTGQLALALTDINGVSGIPSFVKRCAQAGIKPIGGSEIVMEDGTRITLLMDGPTGWTSLCHILTTAALRDIQRKGLRISWGDLEDSTDGLVCLSGGSEHGRIPLLLRRRRFQDAAEHAHVLHHTFGRGNFFLEVTRTLTEGEDALSRRILQLAEHLHIPTVATNTVRYANKMDVAAYDAMSRVRLHLSPQEDHAELPLNGERYLKPAEAMSRLFSDSPEAVANAGRLAERLRSPLEPGTRHYPLYGRIPSGESAFSFLASLTWCGAEKRYGSHFNDGVKTRLVHEIETIRDLGFCDYFLVCWDICHEARRRGIAHAMRGSAVGSAVSHCLFMSEHDPISRNISFDRFLSRGRVKPPDIDIDFQHDLRDDMMQYVRQTYGDDRVANVSNYVTYRARSLLRDLGKTLGFNTGEIDRLREMLGHCRGDDLAEEIGRTPELRAIGIQPERYADLFALCAQLSGLPRHLGTHSSGIVISDVPIGEVAPLTWAAKGVTVVTLDKDDVEAEGVGLLKIDQLALRALTAISLANESLKETAPVFDYATRDRDDPETLAMIRAARTVAGFQLESPAQMALQWRLKATKFDDLVASVALIRPGPLLGKTVEPYIRRRHGWEKVTYPLPELEPVLRETYGRVLFQDQVLDVVRIVGDLSEDEADAFQKAITHARNQEEMGRLGRGLYERAKIKRMTKRSFSRLWKQIQGFSKYGFCLGHALAFADHAQGTAYLLRHHPAEFLAAVLSVEPCGFWPISTVVAEAQRRGVRVLGPCVNQSASRSWRLEEGGVAIRCSLTYVRSLRAVAAAVEEERRMRGSFASLMEFCRRCHFLSREQVEWLALSGGLDSFSPNRRQTLWSLPALQHTDRVLRRGRGQEVATGQEAFGLEVPPLLPQGLADFSFRESFMKQYVAIGFSSEGHPIEFFREELNRQGIIRCDDLQRVRPGEKVAVAGLVVRPHRPPTAGGVVFFTLADETGLAHVTVMRQVYEQSGAEIYSSPALTVCGQAERRGSGTFLIASAMSVL